MKFKKIILNERKKILGREKPSQVTGGSIPFIDLRMEETNVTI